VFKEALPIRPTLVRTNTSLHSTKWFYENIRKRKVKLSNGDALSGGDMEVGRQLFKLKIKSMINYKIKAVTHKQDNSVFILVSLAH